jgi:hypothetical protein
MNSQDGAVCGSIDDDMSLLMGGYVVPNLGSADPGGMESGDEARVVPNHNEGTGEDGVEKLGKGSHSSIAIEGMLPLLAEKAPRSKSSAVKVAGIVVSRLRWGGCPCQSNDAGVLAMRFWSIDSMPCMGALTCLASCASS